MSELLLAIDGNSLMHRAFYALPAMNAPDGRPVNAVYGFVNMLLKVVAEHQPQYLVVAFDRHEPTFRHQSYDAYKAGRRATPEDLRPQFPVLRELLESMGVATVDAIGFEADDILGCFAAKCEHNGIRAAIVTGDQDALQLISGSTKVLLTKKGISETLPMDEEALREAFGLMPGQIPDLKGLMGDSSDNIPGIKGVGEKTALELLHQYGTIEGVLENADKLKGKLAEKVAAGKEDAIQSKWLATIVCDVPGVPEPEGCVLPAFDAAPAVKAMESLAFMSFVKRLRAMGNGNASGAPSPVVQPATRCQRLDTLEELAEKVQRLAADTRVAVHVEDNVFLIGEKTGYYLVPIQRDLLSVGLVLEEAIACIKPLLESDVPKVVHDAKAWLHFGNEFGFSIRNVTFDIKLAAHLLDSSRGNYTLPAVLVAAGYAAGDEMAGGLLGLAQKQETLLKHQGMWALYEDIEMPLQSVLYQMETIGFRVDPKILRGIGNDLDERLGKLTASIYELAGEEFNILSPKQLSAVLFERLQLPTAKKTKTGYSTDADVLEKLADEHPVVSLVLEYRGLAKLKGTYVDGLIPLIQKDGRIRTQFHQTGTATGRLSSSEPNLQNIPVRTPEGRLIRKAFVAADEKHVLVDADYSQIELRILAHVSQDQAMIQAFLAGDDFHRRTAAEVFGLTLEEVTPELRSGAKAINFGIVYGISDFGLARQLGISRQKAGDYIEKYLNTYPGIRALMERTLAEGREKGYVSTLFGRRRPCPELRSANHNIRSAGERMAINAPIQGAAADIIKIAMLRVHSELEAQGFKAKLILQVHDELIVDTPLEEKEAVQAIVTQVMQAVAQLSVPLVAEASSGEDWYHAKG